MRSVVLLVVALSGCSSSGEPPLLLEAPPVGEGFQLSIRVPAPPGRETWLCQVGELVAGTGIAPVHRVESRQTAGMHHMNVLALSLSGVDIPPGIHDCETIWNDHPELMESAVYLYASQQPEQELVLPDGVAALVPGRITVMQEIHYVNTGTREVMAESTVNAYTMPQADVRDSIWGSAVRDTHLQIPPHGRHTEWIRCVMNRDVELILASTHTHQLATTATISLFDGESTGEEIYRNEDWHAPPLSAFDPPIPLRAGQGLELRCEFDNVTDETVRYGFRAADEMCQLAIVHTPGDASALCEVVESSDGVID